jgi:hypothetical protein
MERKICVIIEMIELAWRSMCDIEQKNLIFEPLKNRLCIFLDKTGRKDRNGEGGR